jgi:hypothetical protein
MLGVILELSLSCAFTLVASNEIENTKPAVSKERKEFDLIFLALH